jgi:hypothetical protein
MHSAPTINCVEGVARVATVWTSTIRCYTYPPLAANALSPRLDLELERLVQAMSLLMRIDIELREARADWNEDRFRRLMRLRPRAVSRLQRLWERLNPQPQIPLGSLRRRYHANIAAYLYSVTQD